MSKRNHDPFPIRALAATPIAAIAFSLTSCSMKKNMDEMHDKTLEMAQTTGQMARTTEGMAETTKKMEGTTCVMYRSVRQGNTKLSRDQDMKDIADADSISAKLAEAAEYMMGFEYQVWTPDCIGEVEREDILDQAAKELLSKFSRFASDRKSVGATKTSDRMENVYAFAATLHYENPLQKSLLKGSDHQVLRPLDILVQGLKLDQKRLRGEATEATPLYAYSVAKYAQDVAYLLRVRQNFLMAYAYSLADSNTYGDAPGTLAKLKRIVQTSWKKESWVPQLRNRTATEITERITAALDLSLETHEALVALGIDPMVDPILGEIWERADFAPYEKATSGRSANAAERSFGQAVKRLESARNRIVSAHKKSQYTK